MPTEPEPQEGPEPQEEKKSAELVQVFDASQESEAMVVRGLLEANGIDALAAGRDATQEVLPGVGGTVLRVRPEQAGEARRLIAEHLRDPAADDAEDELSAEPGPPE
jgi:hypothetical protein